MGNLPNSVKTVPKIGHDRFSQDKGEAPIKQVYKPKNLMLAKILDAGQNKADEIQIGSASVKLGSVFSGPITIGDSKTIPIEDFGFKLAANDFEASGSGSKPVHEYPRWCPPGLTHTQKRRLQRLRMKEMKDREQEE